MSFNLPILLFGIAANLLLGLFVFIRNRKSATHILFFFLILDIISWSAANYIALGTKDLLTVLTWTRIVMALAVPQAIIFFFLVHTLPEHRMRLSPGVIGGFIVAGILTAAVCVSPYLFPSVIFVNGTPSPTPGPAMPLFVLVAVGSVIAGVVTLIRRLRRAHGLLKRQLEIVGIGIVSMFVLILFFNFVLVVFFDTSSYISFSPLYTLPFVVATGYAIIRHRFLDVRAVVARAVSYTFVISLFGLLYALIFSLASTFFVTTFVDPHVVVVSTVAALLMLLTFPLVRRLVERSTDAVFYKDRYNADAVLFRLTEIMAATLRLEDLIHQVLVEFLSSLHIIKGAVMLLQDGLVTAVLSEGFAPFPVIDEAHIKLLSETNGIVNIDDLREGKQKSVLRELDVSTAVPLRTEGALIGILFLGAKASGEIYSERDLSLVELFAPEAAVAVQNALAYEEIRRFNVTLQEEVDRATGDLKRANERLRGLDKLKDEFVSLASHELRTPLSAIRSYIWMALSGKGGALSERQQYYLDRASSSTDRLIKLVNDMLNISRIESGRMAIRFAETDMVSLVQKIVDEVRPKLQENALAFSFSVSDRLPSVIADPDKISEVVMNYLSNAIKFTPKGGRIRVVIADEGAMVRVSVTDTGIGIAGKNIGKLFAKFGALHPEGVPDMVAAQSTGLGLYISKSIVEKHGGQVGAVSPGEGRGATFSFTLPVYSEETLKRLERSVHSEGLGIIHSSI